MPRTKANNAGAKARHDPLATQLRKDEILVDDEEAAAMGGGKGEEKIRRKRRRKVRKNLAVQDDSTETFLEAKLAGKVMEMAEKQREELEREGELGGSSTLEFPADPLPEPKLFAYESDGEESEFSEDEDNYLVDTELDPADARLLAMFMGGSSRPQEARTLADLLMEKLREEEGAITLGGSALDVGERLGANLPKRVVKAYTVVGRVLRQYKSGKLPKAFKVIPALENWEEIVFITDPSSWSKQAMYQAVKIFASNLNAKMAQRFFNLVLLPCIREDIGENRKLNFHLYQALRKALYKPAAFYKGIVLPILAEGCTLREAMIVASVLAKSRIPMLHSAAAMLHMMEMPFTGPIMIILQTLINKKYALPLRVVDGLIQFFVTFRDVDAEMPLVWHNALLTFAQRYRSDLQDFQLELLRELLHVQFHKYVTPEIRRVLFNARPADNPLAPSSAASNVISYAGPDPVTMDAIPMFSTPLTN